MTTSNSAHAYALTTGGLDALADAAKISDVRALVRYADALIDDGLADDAAPAGGWWEELTVATMRTPTALDVEARCPGGWWRILGWAFASAGIDGLVAWGVPVHRAEAVAIELLADALDAPAA